MGQTVDREKPFYFSKSATALRRIRRRRSPIRPARRIITSNSSWWSRSARRVPKAPRATRCRAVFGYACGLDMTRRDLQLAERAKQRPWTLGKDVEASAPVSAIAPAARIGHPVSGRIELKQNGVVRQSSDIGAMVWSVAEILAHLSGFYHLGPGDLIFTGTPAGVGPVLPGDRLEGAIEGVGALTRHRGPERMSARGKLATAIGAISGTSMDGIDVALIRSDGGSRVETGPGATFPYPAEVGAALRAVVADPDRALGPLAELERAVTDAHVAAIEAFLRQVRNRPAERRARRAARPDGAASAARKIHPPALRRRARRRGARNRRRQRFPRRGRRGGRRRRAAGSALSRGDVRGARTPADGAELGRRRQRHLSRRRTARSSPSTPAPPMR